MGMSKTSITNVLRPADLNSAMGRGEHISLETAALETRVPPRSDRSVATFELNNRARGVVTEINILEDYYVAVSVRRRSAVHAHNVDLRFVDPRPKASRHVSWRWLCAALLLGAATAIVILLDLYTALAPVQQYGVSTAAVLGALTTVACLACYYRTVESMFFLSIHGRVPVIVISGNLGTFRKGRPCVAEIVRHIHLARTHFKQSKADHLRAEMREHARLQEQTALTAKQYDDAKLRILRAHA